MFRAFTTSLVSISCLVALACGTPARQPASTADTAEALLDVKAEVLRAEDRRVVDDALLAALENKQPEIRTLAVRAIGRIGDTDHSSRLVEMAKDPDAAVRAATAFALGLIGDADNLKTLVRLGDDDSPEVRAATATALGLIASGDGEAAITLLLRDRNESVVTRACFAIPRFSRPGFAVEHLEELSRSKVGDIVFACTWALSEVASRAERLDRTARTTARGRMIELTGSKFAVLRRMAARGLTVPTREEEAASVGPLVEDPEPAVRIAAIRAISFPGAPLEPFLTKVLQKGQEEDDRVYLALVDALGEMRGTDVVAQLADIVVFDPRVWIKERAILSLGRASSYSAKMASGLSRSEEIALRRATSKVLIGRIDEETIESARRLYDDPDPTVKAAIIPAFADIDGILSEVLADAVASDDSRILRAVAVAAGRTLSDETADTSAADDAIRLLERLWQAAKESGDTQLALAVVQAAGRSAPGAGAREILEQGLAHEVWQVRLTSAEELERGYDEPSRTGLGSASDRPIETYREIVRWAAPPRAAIVTVERPGFLPGRFTLRFDTEQAPLSSYRFAQLAEQGAFDELPFFRLVPEVALFAGDRLSERRDVAYLDLRDEINDRLFLSGTVSWETSGTDRADGTWLLTLTPQPELLGSKTAFARVVQNFPGVVAQLLPFDRVKSIEIYQGDGSEPLPELEE